MWYRNPELARPGQGHQLCQFRRAIAVGTYEACGMCPDGPGTTPTVQIIPQHRIVTVLVGHPERLVPSRQAGAGHGIPIPSLAIWEQGVSVLSTSFTAVAPR